MRILLPAVLLVAGSQLSAATALQIDVSVTVHSISVRWSDTSTGNKTWALGSVIGGQTLVTDSGAAAADFTVENVSGAAVKLTVACATNTTGAAPQWSKASSAGADAFKMETGTYAAGSGDTAYGLDLSTGPLVIPSLANNGTWRFNLRFTAPTSSTDTGAKGIAVTATAAAP